jgi:hydroxyethylthiazole kinase-like uncharacterized protein yjeF
MSICSPETMLALEHSAFADGISAEALMEEAGRGMAAAVYQFAPVPGVCLAVFGKGHNGGDALVCARILSENGWRVYLVAAFPTDALAPLTSRKWDEAGRCETLSLAQLQTWSVDPTRPLVLLDGLLGIGASGTLRSPILEAARAINRLRQRSHAHVFALDLPTGLDAATGTAAPDAVVADVTLTVALAKTGLVADGAERFTGRLAVIPLDALSSRIRLTPTEEAATPHNLAGLWKRRQADAHKGDYGRVSLLAGNRGSVGAAALAALGALRAGAGLVTLWVPRAIYPIAASLVPVECMVQPVDDPRDILSTRADALGIGPGLGLEKPDEVLSVIREFRGPAVVDADALTILAASLETLRHCGGPRLLTPHPGEMARLAPDFPKHSRRDAVREFTKEWAVTLLLKGARTLVGTQGLPLSYNTTGNPGMASGGMGDVLTGVCAALLAQKHTCHDAARLGAWLCGRSAEALVAAGIRSEESLLASDVAGALGEAFQALRKRSA